RQQHRPLLVRGRCRDRAGRRGARGRPAGSGPLDPALQLALLALVEGRAPGGVRPVITVGRANEQAWLGAALVTLLGLLLAAAFLPGPVGAQAEAAFALGDQIGRAHV